MNRVAFTGISLSIAFILVACAGSEDADTARPSGSKDAGSDQSATGGSGGSAGSGLGGSAGTAGNQGGSGGSAGAAGNAGQAGSAGAAGSGGAAGKGGSAGSAGAAGGGGEGGSGGSIGGSGGSAGTGGSSVALIGCADGTREGFADTMAFQTIAACNGAWSIPGIFNMPAMCNREAGNTGVNPTGNGCSVTDLCAPGWRVCYGRDDVLFRNPAGCEGVMTGATSPVFFTTQMSSTGAFLCSTGADAANDLFGCGDLGCNFTSNPDAQQYCAPLIMSSHDLCKGLRNDLQCGDWCNHLGKFPALDNAWDCGSDGENEAHNVIKTDPDTQGGVLCCLEE